MLNAVSTQFHGKEKTGRGLRTTRFRIAAAVVILVSVLSISLGYAVAVTLPPSGRPKPLSQYGVARLYATLTFNGRAQITITGPEAAPFFVSSLTVFLDLPATSAITMNTINVDSTGAIQLSGSGSAPSSQIVVVPSGLTYGDIVQSMPSYLSFLMMKDPLGNNAIVASGGDGGGIIISLGYMTGGGLGGSAGMTVIATVVAPTDTTVTMTVG